MTRIVQDCSYRRNRKGDAAREGWPHPRNVAASSSSNCCSGEIAQPFLECLLPFLKDYLKNSAAGSLCRSVISLQAGRLGRNVSQKAFLPRLRSSVCAFAPVCRQRLAARGSAHDALASGQVFLNPVQNELSPHVPFII